MRALLAAIFAALIALGAGPSQALERPQVSWSKQAYRGDIADTHWSGDYDWNNGEGQPWTVWFRRDGVMVYSYGGVTYDNGRWGQRDMLVWMDTNDHFALFVGHRDGQVMQGLSFNKNGLRGSWRLRQ